MTDDELQVRELVRVGVDNESLSMEMHVSNWPCAYFLFSEENDALFYYPFYSSFIFYLSFFSSGNVFFFFYSNICLCLFCWTNLPLLVDNITISVDKLLILLIK